ncbi:MAG: hypothetical protein ACO1PZ_01845 [Gammaproteobacteria bacterium]
MNRTQRPLLHLLALGMVAVTALSAHAQDLPPVSIGAAMRTAYTHIDPEAGDSREKLELENARLFLGAALTSKVKLTLNTEYEGLLEDTRVMDAIVQFESSPAFNIWMGRFLPPADRANLYGPFYSNHWGIYADGIQDGYPFITSGRNDGIAYWGQFDRLSVSTGVFDGEDATGDSTLIKAGRVEMNFWDTEPGYYRSATFYGDRNILSLGAAGQVQGEDQTGVSLDFLLERKLARGDAFTLEAELARYDRLGGYKPRYATDEGGYVLASYLLPGRIGPGRLQALAKFSRATYSGGLTAADPDYDQDTTELNLNYIISGYNARLSLFYMDTRFDAVQQDSKRIGLGLHLIK